MIEDWIEYVVDEGITLKIKPLVSKIAKTSKFDSKGFRRYICEIRRNIKMETPLSWIEENGFDVFMASGPCLVTLNRKIVIYSNNLGFIYLHFYESNRNSTLNQSR